MDKKRPALSEEKWDPWDMVLHEANYNGIGNENPLLVRLHLGQIQHIRNSTGLPINSSSEISY